MGSYQKYITTLSGKKIEICLNSIWDFPNIISSYGNSSYSGRIPEDQKFKRHLSLPNKPKTKLKKEANNYSRKSSNDKKSSKPEDLRLQEI